MEKDEWNATARRRLVLAHLFNRVINTQRCQAALRRRRRSTASGLSYIQAARLRRTGQVGWSGRLLGSGDGLAVRQRAWRMASVTAREGFETPAYALWKYRRSALKIGTHDKRCGLAARTTLWTLKVVLKWFNLMPFKCHLCM